MVRNRALFQSEDALTERIVAPPTPDASKSKVVKGKYLHTHVMLF